MRKAILVLVFGVLIIIAAVAFSRSVAASFGRQSTQASAATTDGDQDTQMSRDMRACCMPNIATRKSMAERCGEMMGNMQSMGMQEGMSARCRKMMGRTAAAETQEDGERPSMGRMCR